MINILISADLCVDLLQESAVHNTILVIYSLSKVTACKEKLLAAPIYIDRTLNKFSSTENTKIKSNISRVIKSLNSDLEEAIEEGTVATLIAMSLEVSKRFLLLFLLV